MFFFSNFLLHCDVIYCTLLLKCVILEVNYNTLCEHTHNAYCQENVQMQIILKIHNRSRFPSAKDHFFVFLFELGLKYFFLMLRNKSEHTHSLVTLVQCTG